MQEPDSIAKRDRIEQSTGSDCSNSPYLDVAVHKDSTVAQDESPPPIRNMNQNTGSLARRRRQLSKGTSGARSVPKERDGFTLRHRS